MELPNSIRLRKRNLRQFVRVLKEGSDGLTNPEIARCSRMTNQRLQNLLADAASSKRIKKREVKALMQLMHRKMSGQLEYRIDRRSGTLHRILLDKKFLKRVVDNLIERYPDLTVQAIENCLGWSEHRLWELMYNSCLHYIRGEEWEALLGLDAAIEEGRAHYAPNARVELAEFSRPLALWNALVEIEQARDQQEAA